MADPFQPKFVDLVRNYSTTVGTDDFVLGSAVNGYTSFTAACAVGDTFYYAAIGVDIPAEREVGRGTLLANGTIARAPVSGAKTNFSKGTKSIALIAAAEWFSSVGSLAASAAPFAVADRTALAATARRGSGDARVLIESGREGTFVFDTSNLSGRVSADPNQGLYVSPTSDTSGASGAWVRKFNGKVNVKWFGAKGDDVTNDGAAFVAALAFLNATSSAGGYSNGNVGLYIPAGHYYLGTTTLDVRTTITIEGEGVGEAGGDGTRLKWDAGATGVIVQEARTVGATGTQAQDNTKSGAASIIRNLRLIGAYNGSNDADYHGVELRARASIRDCCIDSFQGNGIHIAADSLGNGSVPVGNANNFEIYKVILLGNRNGIYTQGGDANAGVITGADCMYNRQWGVSENSFLGNTYVACHAATNTSGPYQTTNPNGRNVFIGCYSESDQPPSGFVSPTVVIGGLHGAGVSGNGSYIRSVLGNTTIDSLAAPSAGVDNLTVNLGQAFQNGASAIMYAGYNGGAHLEYGANINFAGNYKVGLKAQNYATGPVDFYMSGLSLNWVGTDGYGKMLLNDSGLNINGSYKVNGTQVIGSGGLLQAAGFPALAGDVTTTGGSLATTIAANAVSFAKVQQVAPSSLIGNPTAALANAQGITLGGGLTFSGTTLTVGALTPSSIAATGAVTASNLSGTNTGDETSATILSKVSASNITTSGSILSSGAAGIGYTTGAGGTVTQTTSKATAVTLNKTAGAITLSTAALAANAVVSFTLTNSKIGPDDDVRVWVKGGNTAAATYRSWAEGSASGSRLILLQNISGGSLSEAVVLGFAVIKGAIA